MSNSSTHAPATCKHKRIHVGIPVFDGCFASGAASVPDMLLVANHVCQRQFGAEAPQFVWHFLNEHGEQVRSASGMVMTPDTSLNDQTHYDLVFLPAPYYNGQKALYRWLETQRGLCSWIKLQWRTGAVIATYGLGSFLLAEAKLLDDRPATTVWWLEGEFCRRYPKVLLRRNEFITDVDRVICAGAASSYLYLIIKLIERFTSPSIALQCARATQVNIGHSLQSPYLNVNFETTKEDPLVNTARFCIQRDMDKQLRLSELAASLGVSQSTLIRRFKDAMGVTPQIFTQNLRVEAAKQWLLSSQLPIEEIVSRVGYTDPRSFSRLFRQRVGMSPGAYRENFTGVQAG